MNTPPTLDFDYDTMTVSEALPWFKGAAMILIGGMFAGLFALFDWCPLSDFRKITDTLDTLD